MATKNTPKRKRIQANEEKCIGCKLCEVYCIAAHSESKDLIRAFKKEFPRAQSRVIVEENRPVTFALQCRHCEDPVCVSACITGAMTKDEKTGAVTHDAEKCVGCWMCIMVCPYGGIKRDKKEKKIASKCDLCIEVGEAACVINCPNDALEVKED